MSLIKTEEQFLDLAEKFKKDYCLLRNDIINSHFLKLSNSLYEKVYHLYTVAQQLYNYISSSRQIGKYYLLAALSYFAYPHNNTHTQELSSERYLILQASFLTYSQYKKFTRIHKSENKQKQVCDLLRYVSRYVLDSKHIELYEECSDLLVRYVRYECNLTDEGRDQIFNIDAFKQVQVIEYVSALQIIFKRLDDGAVVHRNRISKRHKRLQWPSKKEINIYREKKSGKHEDIGHSAKISFYDASVQQDEDGEVEFLDTEVELYSEDAKTKNFNHLISDFTAYYTRHRQRRHMPFVTNPHYLSPDVLKQIVYLLKTELSLHSNNAAIAAACLLSILTGLSPVALLHFNELIEDGVLIRSGSKKRREYLLNLNLKISEQKIQSLKHVRWNEEMTHQLHLPAAWFDYIEQASNLVISSAKMNSLLKKWLKNKFVGSITVEKLQAQLYFHIYYETYNEYLAHVIAGRDSQHDMPGSYYGGLAKAELNTSYLSYLETVLMPNTVLFTEDTAEIKILEQQFREKPVLSLGRMGSQLALKPHFVKGQFNSLYQHCQANIQKDKHLINQLNAYACWMWHISLLSLTNRPKKNLLGNLDDYCIELRLLYVNDKKNSKARKDGRFIPLTDFFLKALQNYTVFLNQIIESYGTLLKQVFAKKRITLNDLFGKVIDSKDILPITIKEWQSRKIKLNTISRTWVNTYIQEIFPKNMYSNWLRHFDMNFLMYKQEGKTALEFNLIQALYGHDQRDREAFHPHSSLIPKAYVKQARQHLQDNVSFLSIQHLERK